MIVSAPANVGHAADEPPATTVELVGDLLKPREFLRLFDVDEAALAAFRDDAPLDAAEREKLLSLVARWRQYPLAAAEQFSRPLADLNQVAEHPVEYHGELFTLRGRVKKVETVELSAEDRQRFLLDALYRCTLQIETGGADGGLTAMVETPIVPRAWAIDAPLDEPALARGLFIKRLPAEQGGPAYLFIAQRVAWHPDNLLGKLGFDFGLLDGVRDRSKLTERECFYQLLSAVRRAEPGAIETAARGAITQRKQTLEKEIAEPDLTPRDRAALRRELTALRDGGNDVVPLFNAPDQQRGGLFLLSGEALRAVQVRVDDPDVVRRFGIRQYYEIELVTPDSQNNPLVVCVADLPEGLPLGDKIHQSVRVAGFFLKSWAYNTAAGEKRLQLAPLLVARSLEWIATPEAAPQSTLAAVLLGATLAVAAGLMWYLRRGDRRALAAARQASLKLPERIDLDEKVENKFGLGNEDRSDDDADDDPAEAWRKR